MKTFFDPCTRTFRHPAPHPLPQSATPEEHASVDAALHGLSEEFTARVPPAERLHVEMELHAAHAEAVR